MFCTENAMNILRFEVYAVLLMKAQLLWDAMPCQLLRSY